jgi:hypothetical protein
LEIRTEQSTNNFNSGNSGLINDNQDLRDIQISNDKKNKIDRKLNYVFETPRFQESQINAFKNVLEKKLQILSSEYSIEDPFVQPWYSHSKQNTRLG